MITKFKIFENEELSEYTGLFLITKNYSEEHESNSIYLCIRSEFVKNKEEDRNFYLQFDCFDFNKNEILNETYGDFEYFKKEELDKLNFITPEKFYNNYTELCTNLYQRVKHDFDNFNFTEGDGGWYPKLVKNYKKVLETIPEFEHYASAEKYNL